MAGYTAFSSARLGGDSFQFHIDNKDLARRIRSVNNNVRVIVLQLDGDELDAALWGLENYQKGAKVVLQHAPDCPCPVEDCWAAPSLRKVV